MIVKRGFKFLIGVGFFWSVFLGGAKDLVAQKDLTVAMAQIHCINSDTSGNYRRIIYALEDAKSLGADLVCFPETMVYGWVNPEAHKMASEIPGKDANIIRSFAKKYELYICIGLCEKDGEKLYDSALLIDRAGNILLKHRKINVITELMNPPYSKGKGVQVVDTEFGRIGLMICADSFADGVLDEMDQLNPDILLIPYGWANNRDQWPKHGESLRSTITNVAEKLGCPVIGTDALGTITSGPWSGMVFGGQSYAIDKDGTLLAKGRDRERDLLIVKLNQ
jgi:predicted amidohydrolase